MSAPRRYPAELHSPYMLGFLPPEVPCFPRSSRNPSSISSLSSLVMVGMLVFSSLLRSAMLKSPSVMHSPRIFFFSSPFLPSMPCRKSFIMWASVICGKCTLFFPIFLNLFKCLSCSFRHCLPHDQDIRDAHDGEQEECPSWRKVLQ